MNLLKPPGSHMFVSEDKKCKKRLFLCCHLFVPSTTFWLNHWGRTCTEHSGVCVGVGEHLPIPDGNASGATHWGSLIHDLAHCHFVCGGGTSVPSVTELRSDPYDPGTPLPSKHLIIIRFFCQTLAKLPRWKPDKERWCSTSYISFFRLLPLFLRLKD